VRPMPADSAVSMRPSYREGLPRSTLEATSVAALLVTTEVSSRHETVPDRISGLLASARAIKAEAKTMRAFIDAERMLARCAAACVNGWMLVTLGECLK
jgi:glycosyltransferase involved in cell wall biosynthesis